MTTNPWSEKEKYAAWLAWENEHGARRVLTTDHALSCGYPPGVDQLPERIR